MVVPVLFFAAALTVRQDATPLRSGCDAGDEAVASLPVGTAVEIRFRVADGSDCIKIAATIGGKNVSGYVPASALTGLEQFEEGRAQAPSTEAIRILTPIVTETKRVAVRAGNSVLVRASELLEANQPAEALAILEPVLPRYRDDPNVLMLAGLAAYRSDHLRAALDYWKQSLDLAPNENLARVYDHARREAESDSSGDKILGMYVALRYDGAALPSEAGRAMVAVLDQEFGRISSQLGCSPGERIVAIAQSLEAYHRSTGAAEWSGGLYDGRIHVPLMDGKQVGAQTRRTLAHELVHACIANIGQSSARLPLWLNEGLAQKLSGDVLAPALREQLTTMAKAHQIPRLEGLGQQWLGLNAANARVAYAMALAAADALYENYASDGVRNILNNPERVPQLTADLDKKLGF